MKNKNYVLTKAEMIVMEALWSIGHSASVSDVLDRYCEPKPAYTTIATFLKVLTLKGFVEAKKKSTGKTLFYTPLITKERYRRQVMKEVKDSLFGGSAKSLVDFFVHEEQLTAEELQDLLDMINTPEP